MICPNCKKNKAQYDPYWGYLPCSDCQERQATFTTPKAPNEFVPEYLKQDRKANRTDFLPAHRKGQLDKGFVERYGAKKAKQQGFTDTEIKNAKYVWEGDDGVSYYKKGN